MKNNQIAVIGLGYVGLPLALAACKNKKYLVKGLDIDENKIAALKKSALPSTFEVSYSPEIIKNSEFIIICVPTPVKNISQPDLRPLKSATETVLKYLEKGQKIIVESTINPGICEEIVLKILEKSGLKGGLDFELSHCPERINPGDTKWTVENIPRNIGSLTIDGNKIVANFYRSFLKAPINEVSSLKVAEATKIIENTFRDINIAYVNELAKSFDKLGIDLIETIKAASNKPFAFMPHFPGCGVGGHCIPVDPYYLIAKAKKSGFNHSFLKKARSINNSMPAYTVELLENELKKLKTPLTKAKIGILGLAYKENTPDLRESPALKIIETLEKKGITPLTFDPHIKTLSNCTSLSQLLEKSDYLILATAHKEFKELTGKILAKHTIKIIIDGRNCLNKEEILTYKIIYKGIGH